MASVGTSINWAVWGSAVNPGWIQVYMYLYLYLNFSTNFHVLVLVLIGNTIRLHYLALAVCVYVSRDVHLSGIPTYQYFQGSITGIISISSSSVDRYFSRFLSIRQPGSPSAHQSTLTTQHTHLHLYPYRSPCPNTSFAVPSML